MIIFDHSLSAPGNRSFPRVSSAARRCIFCLTQLWIRILSAPTTISPWITDHRSFPPRSVPVCVEASGGYASLWWGFSGPTSGPNFFERRRSLVPLRRCRWHLLRSLELVEFSPASLRTVGILRWCRTWNCTGRSLSCAVNYEMLRSWYRAM